MKLPDAQVAVLETASATEAKTTGQLAEETGLDPTVVAGAAFALEEDGLVEIAEETRVDYQLTPEGARYQEAGLPEARLRLAAEALGAAEDPVPLAEVIAEAEMPDDEADIALSNFARKGFGRIDDGRLIVDPATDPTTDAEATALNVLEMGERGYDEGAVEQLARRGLVTPQETTVRSITLTDDGVTALMEGIEVAETVDAVTPALLTSGDWRDVEFSEYNVGADAPRRSSGNVHLLRQTAERVKDVLVGMGFQEMEGPHADAEFWINDCLFMPQDHPARTHWDQFGLDVPPMDELPEDLMERVERAHREGVGPDGDGYHSPWGEAMARQVDLRGHTTSLSARYLSGFAIGDLEPPQRYFSVEKVYRNDTLDATHLLEFFQIEGWVLAESLSVRDLMGTFEELYSQFGITDIQYKPHYNPYTEPSFELFGEHPTTGEIVEIGNSGLFRDEMLEPLGVDGDVMAWGLALERLLMLTHGFEDIRDVHGTLVDLEFLRSEEVVY